MDSRPAFYTQTSHSSSHHHYYSSSTATASTSTPHHHNFTAESPLLSPDDERGQHDGPESPDSATSSSSTRGVGGFGSRFRFSTRRLRSSIKSGRELSAR